MKSTLRELIVKDPDFPKGYYARMVLYGEQSLSGKDLRGKARAYGGWYNIQRGRVIAVASRYGLFTARTKTGKIVWEDEI